MGHNRTKELIIGIICFIVFAFLFIYVLNSYKKERDDKGSTLIDQPDEQKDYILVKIQVTNIDAVKGDVQARINFEPKGSYTEDENTINKDVIIYVNSVSGKNEHTFPKGKRMLPIDVTLEMYDGVVSDYPFDTHNAELSMLMLTTEKGDSGKTTETTVPIVKEVEFKASVQGFNVEEVKEPGAESDYTEIEMHIQRTNSVKYFSFFVMTLMWFIIIVVVLIMLSIIVRDRKLEYSMFPFLATLLFALPALRNIQPFVPGVGTLSDYISFYWAEAIVAASLIIMVFIWLKRPGVKK